MEFDGFLDYYSSEYYLTYSNTISRESWGNRHIALAYLEKYSLPEDEYLRVWKPIQDVIFKNENISLPEIVFRDSYSLLAIRGGVLFVKEDFEKLKTCAEAIGDQSIVIIRNAFGQATNEPIFKMKYPVDTPWDELMSGNFISTVLFEMFHDEYFVFSESGMWGMYCANDYDSPLNIIGFKPDYADIFKTQFRRSGEEESEIKQWLPSLYIDLIKS